MISIFILISYVVAGPPGPGHHHGHNHDHTHDHPRIIIKDGDGVRVIELNGGDKKINFAEKHTIKTNIGTT